MKTCEIGKERKKQIRKKPPSVCHSPIYPFQKRDKTKNEIKIFFKSDKKCRSRDGGADQGVIILTAELNCTAS